MVVLFNQFLAEFAALSGSFDPIAVKVDVRINTCILLNNENF